MWLMLPAKLAELGDPSAGLRSWERMWLRNPCGWSALLAKLLTVAASEYDSAMAVLHSLPAYARLVPAAGAELLADDSEE